MERLIIAISYLFILINPLEAQDSIYVYGVPDSYYMYETHDQKLMLIYDSSGVVKVKKQELDGSTIFQHSLSIPHQIDTYWPISFQNKKYFLITARDTSSNSTKYKSMHVLNENGQIAYQRYDTLIASGNNYLFGTVQYQHQSDTSFYYLPRQAKYKLSVNVLDYKLNTIHTGVQDTAFSTCNPLFTTDNNELIVFSCLVMSNPNIQPKTIQSWRFNTDGTFSINWNTDNHNLQLPNTNQNQQPDLDFVKAHKFGNGFLFVGGTNLHGGMWNENVVYFLPIDENGYPQIPEFREVIYDNQPFKFTGYTSITSGNMIHVMHRGNMNSDGSTLNNIILHIIYDENFDVQCQRLESLNFKDFQNIFDNNYVRYRFSSQNRDVYVKLNGCNDPGFLGFENNSENEKVFINTYPNPVSENVFITLPFKGIFEISVLNTQGTVITKITTSNETIEVDSGNWKSGLYFIIVVDQNGNTYTEKIIKI